MCIAPNSVKFGSGVPVVGRAEGDSRGRPEKTVEKGLTPRPSERILPISQFAVGDRCGLAGPSAQMLSYL